MVTFLTWLLHGNEPIYKELTYIKFSHIGCGKDNLKVLQTDRNHTSIYSCLFVVLMNAKI